MIKKLEEIFLKENLVAWIFIFPALLGTFIFIILPIFASFGFSLTNWNLISSPEFVGFENYSLLFKDEFFAQVLGNTFVYAISVTALGVIIPLVLAFILNNKLFGDKFLKTSYFLPFVTPMIVLAIVWQWIFDPNFGLLNHLLKTDIKWLYDTDYALIALIIVSVWKNIGYNMIIFLAGLQNISPDIFEASKIDGASSFKNFFHITLPLLSPIIFFVMIVTTISSFQVFDLVYLMTQGGPENSTNIIVYDLYKQAFEFFRVGKASAIAYLLFFIILGLTSIQWFTRKKWVINE